MFREMEIIFVFRGLYCVQPAGQVMLNSKMLARAACMRCHVTECPLLTALVLFLLQPGYFSPRRSYRRVLKFCMGHQVAKKIRFGVKQKFRGTPPAPGARGIGAIFCLMPNTLCGGQIQLNQEKKKNSKIYFA